jgi:hypothetical protein
MAEPNDRKGAAAGAAGHDDVNAADNVDDVAEGEDVAGGGDPAAAAVAAGGGPAAAAAGVDERPDGGRKRRAEDALILDDDGEPDIRGAIPVPIEELFKSRFTPAWGGQPAEAELKAAADVKAGTVVERYCIRERWADSHRLSARQRLAITKPWIGNRNHVDYREFLAKGIDLPPNWTSVVGKARDSAVRKALLHAITMGPKSLDQLADIQLLVAAIGSSCDNVDLQAALADVVHIVGDLGMMLAEIMTQACGFAFERVVAAATKAGTRERESVFGGPQRLRDEAARKIAKKDSVLAKPVPAAAPTPARGGGGAGGRGRALPKAAEGGHRQKFITHVRPRNAGRGGGRGGGGGGGGGTAASSQNSRVGGSGKGSQ